MRRKYEITEDEIRQAVIEWFLRHHEEDVDPNEGIHFMVEVDCECNPEDTELGDITAVVTTEPVGAKS